MTKENYLNIIIFSNQQKINYTEDEYIILKNIKYDKK